MKKLLCLTIICCFAMSLMANNYETQCPCKKECKRSCTTCKTEPKCEKSCHKRKCKCECRCGQICRRTSDCGDKEKCIKTSKHEGICSAPTCDATRKCPGQLECHAGRCVARESKK